MTAAHRIVLRTLLPVLAISLPGPRSAASQEAPPRVTVRVRQIAGATLYMDVGSRQGVLAGDTLGVRRDSASAVLGTLVVTATTEAAAALTFAGRPFPVTRGERLVLQLLRTPNASASTPAPGRPPPERVAAPSGARPPRAAAPRSPVHGRLALDVSAVRSSTRVGGTDPVNVARTFATPALRLDATVPDAVHGLRLRMSLRMEYRYSDRAILQPTTAARVYALSLEGNLGAHTQVALGRFRSPYELYSGYWDGALVRVGGASLGAGAAAGFEPNRWDERPSSAMPKATLFVNGLLRGAGWRWSGDLSGHIVRPRTGEPDHTFVGATQHLTTGLLRLDQDLQLDRNPTRGGWTVSRLRVLATMRLTGTVDLRGGVAREEPWLYGLPGLVFGTRRDRVDAGVGLRGSAGYLSLDGSVTRDASGRWTQGETATFNTSRLPGWEGVGAFASVSRWSGPYGTSLAVSPALTWNVALARVRLGYGLNRSDFLGQVSLTHGIEGSLDTPVATGLRASGRFRLQLGDLRYQSLDLSLYRIF